MKKLLSLAISGMAVLMLNGCGGGGVSDGGIDNPTPTPPVSTVDKVDIANLYEGYEVNGVNDKGDDITLDFCHNYTYVYYRGNMRFSGNFYANSESTKIDMYDDDGGSYIIETYNGFLEVGEYYEIYDVHDEITVEEIVEIDC